MTENEIVKYLVNTFPGTEQTIASGSIGMGENEASHIDLTGENGMEWPGHLTTERTKREGLNLSTQFRRSEPRLAAGDGRKGEQSLSMAC